MSEEIKQGIDALAKRITESVDAGDALKLTQAALNLAHVAQVLKLVEAREA